MKILLAVAGALNLVFAVFHSAMFVGIANLQGTPGATRVILYTFNTTVVLMTTFFAYAMLVRRKEVMNTGLGGGVLVFAALFYLSRAAKDLIWTTSDLSTAAICVAVAVVHIVLLFGARLKSAD